MIGERTRQTILLASLRRTSFLLVVGIASLQATTLWSATIEASAYLNVVNFRIVNVATGQPITIGPGGDLQFVGSAAGGTTSATLNGLNALHVGASADALASYSNGLTTVTPGGIENIFSPRPLGIAIPYARADTNGTGSFGTVVPGPVTTGSITQTIADVVVPNTATIANQGDSASTVAGFNVLAQVSTPVSLRFQFDAAIDVTLDYTLPPPGLLLSGSTAFDTQIIGTGISVDGSASNTFRYAPAELNTGLLTRSIPGLTGGHPGAVFVGFASPVVTLNPGTYTFSLTHGASAAVVPVPEPASIVLAFVTALGAVSLHRRRLLGR